MDEAMKLDLHKPVAKVPRATLAILNWLPVSRGGATLVDDTIWIDGLTATKRWTREAPPTWARAGGRT